MSKASYAIRIIQLAAVALMCSPGVVLAHAVAGMRVFPATLSFDDPGVANEFSANFSNSKAYGTTTNDLAFAYAKTITKRFGLSISTDYQWLNQPGSPDQNGWDNTTIGAAYQVFVNGPHEAIGMLAISDTLANTGSYNTADNFNTVSPEFAFGKGFGDLPWSVKFLRPLAISGAISEDLPSDTSQAKMLNWGLSIQYSIPYLQSFVKDVGVGAPFNNMVPIIEFTRSQCADSNSVCQSSGNADATGSMNPGVIWIGKYYQVGVEATVPSTAASGNHIGILVGIDVYLDDVMPHSLGAPIFG